MRAVAAALALVLIAFAGCSAAPADDPPVDTTGANLTAVAAPIVDARATLDMLKEFSEAFPYRQAANQFHLDARDWLDEHFAAAGLETMRQDFPSTAMTGQNIIGIKWGTDRDHWIVIGGHYDITEGAVYGTYDDGTGTILTMKLAEAFADLPTERTIAFVEFDQEERGLVGSAAFVQAVQEGTFALPIVVDGMIDLDMVGITWPHPADLICWENSDEMKSLVETHRTQAGVPDDHIQYRASTVGSSDGVSFMQGGIATAYFWSNWDEVVLSDGTPVAAAPYPWWHQADTYETMLAMAGTEETLEAGFQTVLDIVSPLLMDMASPGFVGEIRE